MRDGAPLEIERVWLLSGMPELPPHAEALTIRQGYLPIGDPDDPFPGDPEVVPETGRIRSIQRAGAERNHVHTVKRGHGLVREERERTISAAAFDAAWPATAGRRLSKTRWRVSEGDRTWEIDRFDHLDLVLAEVELDDPKQPVQIPDWLAGHLLREVTEEPAFRNAEIAARAGLLE